MKPMGSVAVLLVSMLGLPAVLHAQTAPAAPAAPAVEDAWGDASELDEASADDALAALSGVLPFTRAELEEALVPRLRAAPIAVRAAVYRQRVAVRGATGDAEVMLGARARTIPLGAREGAAAARVIALVLVDLASRSAASDSAPLPLPFPLPAPAPAEAEADAEPASEAPLATPPSPAANREETTPTSATVAAPAPPPVAVASPPEDAPGARGGAPSAASSLQNAVTRAFPPPPPPRASGGPSPAVSAPAQESPSPLSPASPSSPTPSVATAAQAGPHGADSPRTLRFAAFGGMALGAVSEDGLLRSVGVGVGVGVGGWRLAGELAWVHLSAAALEPSSGAAVTTALDGAGLRVELGRALGPLELSLGALAAPYALRVAVADSMDENRRSVLLAGTAALRGQFVLRGPWRLLAGIGVDAFGRKVEVRTTEVVLASTPRVALWGQLGLAWEGRL